jgi:hypothetical protein
MLASSAHAQTLARLHIHAFELSSDKTAVKIGEPFHLTLDVHLDERVASLDNVQLPSLAGFEDLGDERRCTIAPIGTDCVETLTIDALVPGDRTIGPATIEFVDGATSRARSRESNLVTVHVSGTAKVAADSNDASDANDVRQPLWDLLWAGVRGILIFALVAVALWALLWGYGRRPRVAAPAPPAPPPSDPPAPAEVAWEQRLRELGAALASEPTRERAVAVRAEIRVHIGASERETLADLTRRNAAAGDTHVMAALVAVERAAFCEDADVADAAREAVPFLTT